MLKALRFPQPCRRVFVLSVNGIDVVVSLIIDHPATIVLPINLSFLKTVQNIRNIRIK
jgi:hypothetical protein